MLVLSPGLDLTIEKALAFAQERQHEYVVLENFLFVLIEDEDVGALLDACQVDRSLLRQKLTKYIDEALNGDSKDEAETAKLSPRLIKVLYEAEAFCRSSHKQEVTTPYVLRAIMLERQSFAGYFLSDEGALRHDMINFICRDAGKAALPTWPIIKDPAVSPSITYREAAQQLLALSRTEAGAQLLAEFGLNPLAVEKRLWGIPHRDKKAGGTAFADPHELKKGPN